MTTYEQLWSDINFIEKRIPEQEFYILHLMKKLDDGVITKERWVELNDSAMFVLNRLDERQTELINASKIEERNTG